MSDVRGAGKRSSLLRYLILVPFPILLLVALFVLPSGNTNPVSKSKITRHEPKPDKNERFVRLTAQQQRSVELTSLPPDTVVATVGEALAPKAPFVVRRDASAAGGVALVLPEGAGTKERSGRAELEFESCKDGVHIAWARVKWRDSCGNSLLMKVGEGTEHVLGNDHVFGAWHWVKAGKHKLKGGKNSLVLIEREDGIAVDQVLFTQEKKYLPTGPIRKAREEKALRRFADTFTRSPGHGLDAWDLQEGKWKIEFSLDPNRIPNQYALAGEAEAKPAVALVNVPPWKGCHLAFCFFPFENSEAGAVLDAGDADKGALHVAFKTTNKKTCLVINGDGIDIKTDLKDKVRANQWHRVEIERWAWVLRVRVDEREVLARYDLPLRSGRVGMLARKGKAVFDDIDVHEILWSADDGIDRGIAWRPDERAEWYRWKHGKGPKGDDTEALIGRSGANGIMPVELSLEEVLIEESPEAAGHCRLVGEGLEPLKPQKGIRSFRRVSRKPVRTFSLQADDKEAHVRRIAYRCGRVAHDSEVIGPFHFTSTRIEDPSDYLDFTKEEYERIKKSPDAQKLLRRAKFKSLIGRRGTIDSPWSRDSGNWKQKNGEVVGTGPNALLRLTQDVMGDLQLDARVKLLTRDAVADLAFYAKPGASVRVRLKGPLIKGPPSEKVVLSLDTPVDEAWHRVRVKFAGNKLTASVDEGEAKTIEIKRGDGGGFGLLVADGSVAFDDIELTLPRHSENSCFYAFRRREPDWWREDGPWMDHAGISCALASNWVSLLGDESKGLLWNKRTFGPDVAVATNIEENTEWYGWSKHPSHKHFPYDNVQIVLSDGFNAKKGYRIDFNADDRSATILYRNGKEVARVSQEHGFPIHYRGGHAPYSPRRSRVGIVKRGGAIRAIVNSKEVLTYTDPNPIKVSRVAVGGYRTRVNYGYIEVRRLESSPAESEPKASESVSKSSN